ncbi:hypothetical protein GRI58_02365 [Porphyrobacter algicida]|uniref:DUF4231 domain-containing protein n=1 Tax=Qipengyuania algicida TaxID=1836209 RepID=A0A845AFT4_9SPHN|nr:hypothetical protein [Qipengyuania algicida]MXP27665.1 hypothetical protein [Qipengyuania algicida]
MTGHRPPRLKVDQFPRIERELAAVFGQLNILLGDLHRTHGALYASQDPRIELVSPLASGSDSITARVALQVGAQLDASLPFSPSTYQADFDPEENEQFESLVAQATRVLALPGEDYERSEAYRAVGLLNMAQCDLLLAIWDGKPAQGIGGTPEIIADAVASGVPVLVIDANGESEPSLLWNSSDSESHDAPTLDTVARSDAANSLADMVATLLAPPPGARELIADLEKAVDGKWGRSMAYPLLLWLTGARGWKAAFRRDGLKQSADQLEPMLSCFDGHSKSAEAASSRLLPRFAAADLAANRFAGLYRGGYVANFTLAALAVAFALAGVLAPPFKVLFILAELMTISLIIMRTRKATQSAWHRRWIDCRHLTELLRVQPLSAALGDLTLLRTHEPQSGGVAGWYARATARELGMFDGKIDRSHAARVRGHTLALIGDQIGYHRSNAARMDKMDHRIRHLGEWLFIGTIGACLAWLLAKFTVGPHVGIFGVDVTELVTFLTALLPAIGGALYGIRMQGDFAGSAERSRAIHWRLERLANAIERDPRDYRGLSRRLKRLTEIMLAEVDQWRQLSEVRPLELPG